MSDKALEEWMVRSRARRAEIQARELFDEDGVLKRDPSFTALRGLDPGLGEALQRAARDAYTGFKANHGDFSPISTRCHLLAPLFVSILNGIDGIEAELIRRRERIDLGDMYASGHSHLRFRFNRGPWYRLDPMYLQFVDEGQRVGLPDIMLFQEDVDFERGLTAHNIASALHRVWRT